MREQYGRGVVYNANATVGHKVFAYRIEPGWLLKRAFWQGYSKRAMEVIVSDDASAEESTFLKRLLVEFAPDRLKNLLTKPNLPKALQFVVLFLLTGIVGMGYLYGLVKWR
jgi:hypothetical protein